MLTHAQARGILEGAFAEVFGRTPTLAEVQTLQAVGLYESSYTSGWKEGKGKGSFNWGAITTNHPNSYSFKHEDSRRDPSGELVKYVTYFRGYPTIEAGAVDLVRVLFESRPVVMRAVNVSPRAVAQAIRDTKYSLGTAKTYEGQVTQLEDRLTGALGQIVTALDEPMAVGRSSRKPGSGGGSTLLVLAVSGVTAYYLARRRRKRAA